MLKLCNSINDRISISDVKKQFANGIIFFSSSISKSASIFSWHGKLYI